VKTSPQEEFESFAQISRRFSPFIEKALRRFLTARRGVPREIDEAMRYAVLNGGKRFRPLLVLVACEAVGGDPKRALLPACAVEFIHAYSLVHDDLPALDNDEFRRGKLTCHRKFGEAVAILTGDALLTRAFELLTEIKPAAKSVLLIQELANAAGTRGMIGGQVVDILTAKDGSGVAPSVSSLDYISRHKTGRLIEASAVLGATVSTDDSAQLKRVRRFGQALGLAFQVVDDIMDGDGYLRVMNLYEAEQKAEALIQKATQKAKRFGSRGKGLLALADFLSLSLSQSRVGGRVSPQRTPLVANPL
jgi:geranylgeranyl diphosphate synthase type II